MVNQEIKKTLDKFVEEIHNLGNGNFGLREGFLVQDLWISTSFPGSGNLVVRNNKLRDGWDCGRTAFRVGEELRDKGFEVKYKFTRSEEGSIQNYAEVLDPESKQWIQVDATPWYEQLNPGYKESGEHDTPTKESYAKITLNKEGGPMLSLEKQATDTFIETYLCGGFSSTSDKLSELIERSKGKKQDNTKKPQYSLRLWSKLCKSVVDKTLDRIDVSVDILDSSKIWGYKGRMLAGEWMEKPEETLEMLAKDGVIRFKVEDYADFLSNTASAMIGSNSFKCGKATMDYLEVIAGHSSVKQDMVRNIRANLGALTNLIFHLYPTIITSDGDHSVHIETGIVTNNEKSRYFNEIPLRYNESLRGFLNPVQR